MAQSTVSIRIDEDLKKRVETLADAFGMNLTTLVTVFLRAVEREREIPFKISAADPFYSGANWRHVQAAIAEFDDPSKPKIVKTMEELEAMADE